MVSNTPRPHLTPGKTRYPLYRRLGGPQGRSGRAENLAPPGIDPRTVEPVVSRYPAQTYVIYLGSNKVDLRGTGKGRNKLDTEYIQSKVTNVLSC